MNCWLGDEKVALPDLNTQDPGVQSGYGDWIADLVKEYSIDGLRIDGMRLDPLFVTCHPQHFIQLPNTWTVASGAAFVPVLAFSALVKSTEMISTLRRNFRGPKPWTPSSTSQCIAHLSRHSSSLVTPTLLGWLAPMTL